MYPTTVSIVFFVALAAIAADIVLRFVFRRTKTADAGAQGGLVAWLRIAVNLAGLAALAAAVYTGIPPALEKSGQLTGDALIDHVTVAPPFAILAVVVTLFWAHRNRFSDGDGGRLISPGAHSAPLRKLFFWLAVFFAVPTLLSILAAMFPLFDAEGQQELFAIHRYCALFLAGSGFLFAYFSLMAWREGSPD